jgi:2'-5' RNA ligase
MASSRLFLAIPIPSHIQKEIWEAMEIFAGTNGIRLTPPDNYHITVHFFGEIENDAIEKLKADIAQKAQTHGAFSMQINSLAVYNQRHAKILWVGFFPGSAFSGLAVGIQKMAIANWQSKQEKEQTPHITCARIKNTKLELPQLPPITQYEIPVNNIELWKTISEKGGVRYLSLHRFALRS